MVSDLSRCWCFLCSLCCMQHRMTKQNKNRETANLGALI